MELSKQADLKECCVKLEKLSELDMRITDTDSDSDFCDLPPPKYFSPCKTKPKLKKTAAELLAEQQNLLNIIETDTLSNTKMEEKILSLETLHCDDIENEPQSPTPCEVKKDLFCVNDCLQFFNSYDVTPLRCGYENSIGISAFEEQMLSFKRAELEYVIPSFLQTSTSCCISDCKSFITYLLRNISVREDTASIFACFNALNSILAEHLDADTLSFSSADIFMLLFNYGIDIDSFKYLQQWSNVTEHLASPEIKTKKLLKIPSKWTFNLKMILRSLSKLVYICKFDDLDLCQIIIFLLWLSLDSRILQENLLSLVRENISTCLKRITMGKWEETFCEIAETVIQMEFPNRKQKWENILEFTEYVPVYLKRGIQLRRHISFSALQLMFSENSESDVGKKYIEFDLSELQNLLQKLSELDNETLCFATKFMDIYITNLSATKEVYQEVCNLLKRSEGILHHEAYDVKRHFSEIYTKLKILIGKDSVYKVSLLENVSRKIKQEVVDASSECEVPSLENAEREINMQVEEGVCAENVIRIKSEPVDSDFTSGEQSICSSDGADLNSCKLNDDISKGDISDNLELASNLNAIKSECTESDSEVTESDVLPKKYFIHSSMDVEEHVNNDMKSLNTSTLSFDDNELFSDTKADDHCESSQSSASVCESVDEVVQNVNHEMGNMNTSLMLGSESEIKSVTDHEYLENVSVIHSINESCNLPKQNVYDTVQTTMQAMEHYEPQCKGLWADVNKVVLVNKPPDSIEPETKLPNFGDDDGIEIVEVHSNVEVSFQEDSILQENVQSMPSQRTECAKNCNLISDSNVFPEVIKPINSQCEAVLDELLVSIDVAEEVCIDFSNNQMLNNNTESIEGQLVSLLKNKQEDTAEKDKCEANTEMEASKINDSLLNSMASEGDCNVKTDELIGNGINEKSSLVDYISCGEKPVVDIFMAQDVCNYQPCEEYPTCKDNDLVAAIKGDMEVRYAENLKRKSEFSFDYKPLSKKHKTENLKRISQIMDPVISSVLERVVNETANSYENSQNKCQPNAEILTNKEYPNSPLYLSGDCDLEILDEKEIKNQDEDLAVIHIKHPKTTVKNASTGSSGHNKIKGFKRAIKSENDGRDFFHHKLKRKSLPSSSESKTHYEKRRSESSVWKKKSSKSGNSGLKHTTANRNKAPPSRIDSKKSRKHMSNYMYINKQKYAREKKEIFSISGLSLIVSEYSEPNILKSNLEASTSAIQAGQAIYISSDSDSDVVELYTDPKRYADKDCLIVFESEDHIVIDSD